MGAMVRSSAVTGPSWLYVGDQVRIEAFVSSYKLLVFHAQRDAFTRQVAHRVRALAKFRAELRNWHP